MGFGYTGESLKSQFHVMSLCLLNLPVYSICFWKENWLIGYFFPIMLLK